MNLSRNLIQGAAGGLLGAAILGLLEAVYLLASQGAPDLLSPFYAVVLYGLIGMGLGLGGGVVLSIVEKLKLKKKDGGEGFAFAFGSVSAVAPMMLFILMYVVNKVVYLEAGVPLLGKLAILVVVLIFVFVELTLGAAMVTHPFKFLLRGPGVLGTWAGLAVATGLLSFVPVSDDPRDDFATGKAVPDALAASPNVLVIAVDTLRADYLGTYGKEGDPTPVLDAFAADGVVFEQNFAAASWTRSSFATIWSSRIPSSHNADTKAARMPDEVDLLSEVLQRNGVATANLANNINVTSTFNFDQGYDAFVYESPAYAFGATESVFSLTFYKVVHKLNEKLGFAKHVDAFYQPAEVVLADARAFIEANANARWMLGIHLMEPHDPYFEHPYLMGEGDAEFNGVGFARAEVESPKMEDAEYLKQVYLDEIKHLDLKLKPFFEYLKAKGLYDDMMILLISDHGEEFGEHGGFWHGTTLYEEQIRVPLVVKMPGGAFAGTRVPWQSRNLDIAPTVAAAMGVAPSDQWEGRDLMMDVAADKADADRRAAERAAVVSELAAIEARVTAGESGDELAAELVATQARLAALAPADDDCTPYQRERERLVVAEEDFEGNVISAIRKDGFKLIRANEDNPRGLPTSVLYDVVADPGETEDVSGSSEQVCGQYVSDVAGTHATELGEILTAAASRANEGGSAEMSAAEKQKLCALGYLSGPDCE